MVIISTAPPKPRRNRVMTKRDRLGEKAARSTVQMRMQAKVTVFFGPSFTRIQAATKLPTILAREMALFTEAGRRIM